MPSAVRLREDYSAEERRWPGGQRLQPEPAASAADCGPGRHGLRLGREDRRHGPPDAARLGPSLSGPEGLIGNWTAGPKFCVSEEQLAHFAQIFEAGPDREKDRVVRWRRLDLKHVIAERFGVDLSESSSRSLASRISAPGRAIRVRTSGSSKPLPQAGLNEVRGLAVGLGG